jgi:DNA-binding response OmpR family regulator
LIEVNSVNGHLAQRDEGMRPSAKSPPSAYEACATVARPPNCFFFEPVETMRILIIEDNDKMATLLAKRLTENLFVVDLAKTVDEALGALEVVDYNLVVLDLTLPDGNGIDVLRTLRMKGKPVPVLIETARDDVTHRVEALNQGADDYIVKPFSSEELLARVRAILRRPRQTAPSELGNVELNLEGLSLRINGEPVEIARREFEVLAALFRSHGRIIPRERLEEAIYSFDVEVTPNAIEATVSRLRRRLEAEGATIAITAMRGLGYVLGERAAC